MTDLILPLANREMGTIVIIFFAILCVALSALVVSFVLSGKKKNDKETTVSGKNNF